MQTKIFSESQLPIKQLEQLGLAAEGRILLSLDNLNALLSGNRTEMLKLKNLSIDGDRIEQIDAKISISPNQRGELEVKQHPIYKEAVRPDALTVLEAKELESAVLENLIKEVKTQDGRMKEMLFQFDRETKEFLVTDIDKIMVPDFVNSQELTAAQKEAYRKGREIELLDGTAFKFAAAEAASIRANRIGLIVSVLFDGGISYLLYHGLKSLSGNNQTESSAHDFSEGYHRAVKEYQQQQIGIKPQGFGDRGEQELEERQHRSISR